MSGHIVIAPQGSSSSHQCPGGGPHTHGSNPHSGHGYPGGAPHPGQGGSYYPGGPTHAHGTRFRLKLGSVFPKINKLLPGKGGFSAYIKERRPKISEEDKKGKMGELEGASFVDKAGTPLSYLAWAAELEKNFALPAAKIEQLFGKRLDAVWRSHFSSGSFTQTKPDSSQRQGGADSTSPRNKYYLWQNRISYIPR